MTQTETTIRDALNRDAVTALSARYSEPDWLLQRRLEAWRAFEAAPMPDPLSEEWRHSDATKLTLDGLAPYTPAPDGVDSPEALPAGLRPVWDEGEELAARLIQLDSGVVPRPLSEALAGQGVIVPPLHTPARDPGARGAPREDTRRQRRRALPPRVRWQGGRGVGTMQRLHPRDLTGVLLEEEPGLWTHLMLPAEFEPSWRDKDGLHGHPHPCPFDWRTEPGELLFPELFDQKRLDELKVGLTEYGEAGQLQQRPHPREGGMMKRDDFKIIDAADVPKGGVIVRGWDLAATDAREANAKNASWTVGLRLRYVKRKIYVEDVIRFRGSPHKVRTKMRTAADQDGRIVIIDFPPDPGQAGKAKAQDIAADFPDRRAYYSPESGDKTVRAEAPAAQVEAGNVYLVRGAWNGLFLDEAAAFPGSTFKDQIDALSRAYHRAVRAPARPRSGSIAGAA